MVSKRPRNAAALELAALQGDLGAARIRLEQIMVAAERLAADCARMLASPPFSAPQQAGGLYGSQQSGA